MSFVLFFLMWSILVVGHILWRMGTSGHGEGARALARYLPHGNKLICIELDAVE